MVEVSMVEVSSMRRPPEGKYFFLEHVHRRAKHRSATLPSALVEGPHRGRCTLGSEPFEC